MRSDQALKLAAQMIADSLDHKHDVSKQKMAKIRWNFKTNEYPPSGVNVLTIDHGSPISLSLPEQGQREKLQKLNTIINISCEWCFASYSTSNEIINRHMVVGHFIGNKKHHRSFFYYVENKMRQHIRQHFEQSRIDTEKTVVVLDNCSGEQKNRFFLASLKFASYDRQLFFKCSQHSKDRVDGHHRLVREGAKLVNSTYKGYCPKTLADELNVKEVDDRRKRQQRNNNHLSRVYFYIPDDISEFEIPNVSSNVRFNVSDTRSAIYIKAKDSLYLTASRCGCNICLTDSFINCKETKHQTHIYSMVNIKSDKTYPEPSSANSIPISISEPLSTNDACKLNATKLVVRETRSKATISENVAPSEASIRPNKTKNVETHNKDMDQNFRNAKSLKERITWISSSCLQKIKCNLSLEEIALAKSEIEKMENNSRFNNQHMGCFDDYLQCPFKPREEYELGDCDILCNRFRGVAHTSCCPPMKRKEGNTDDGIEIMNPSTLNSLSRLMLHGEFQSYNDFIFAAMDEFSGGLPSSNFQSLIIVAYSTVGMKRKSKKGVFQYDNTAGHFITLNLKMNDSTVHIYDHLNEAFDQSSYFDFKLISKILQCLHDFHKRQRDEEEKMLEFIQHNVKKQTDSNCGPHAIVNAELLLHKLDPALQSFDRKVTNSIRSYHLLLKQCLIDDFRLSLQTE